MHNSEWNLTRIGKRGIIWEMIQVSWEECSETCEDECSMMHFKE